MLATQLKNSVHAGNLTSIVWRLPLYSSPFLFHVHASLSLSLSIFAVNSRSRIPNRTVEYFLYDTIKETTY